MIVEIVISGLLTLLGYMIRENTKALKSIADNIAYCPTNKTNKKIIKGDS